ncbi:MAG: alpha,alpha-trehalose-phosphate synthase (UDP-forming) [Phycisphaerales bacterium]
MPGTNRRSRLIIVANRLPVRRAKSKGRSVWETSPGGLVTAMTPILNETGGSWVGWAGSAGKSPPPFKHENMQIRPVSISADQLEKFYGGFSNSTLWPLYHDSVRTPQFHRRWWWPYVDVNRVFAEACAAEAGEGDTVWVHDYQLQLVPGMLRERLPRVKIGFFLHIPFPPEELFAQLPWRSEILAGMLGADVVGFQTPQGCRNFVAAAKMFAGAKGTERSLRFRGRTIEVRAFPISIDVAHMEAVGTSAPVLDLEAQLKRDLGSSSDGARRIFLGVDRLDYTKGIDIRLRAYEEMLRRGSVSAEECVMVQVAVPSRESVDDYAELRAYVERLAGRINGQYGRPGRAALHYLYRSLPFEELSAYYRMADVMVVTPLRDGMNLVAKEYVAAKAGDSGVLVLSEFAGAAHELKGGALLVNPHDIDGLAATMEAAMALPATERARRMSLLQRAVRRNDVFRWARSFLDALSGSSPTTSGHE